MHKYHKSLHIISNFASKATPVERICEGIEFKHLSSNFGFQFNLSHHKNFQLLSASLHSE